MTRQETILSWMGHVLVALLVAVAFFTAWPSIDLSISRLFGTIDGFAANNNPYLEGIRMALILLANGAILGLIAALAISFVVPARIFIRRRVLMFCIATYAIGPGLVTNGLLKRTSERARPRDIIEFGGGLEYSRPFELAGQCTSNCSFVSGETSALTAVALMVLLIIVPQLSQRYRPWTTCATLTALSIGAGLRIVFGAHFPSDVIFAVLITSMIVLGLYLAFGLQNMPSPFTPREKPLGPSLSIA